MSFFADLLAGSAAGFGKVMVDSAEADDRREAALQLQREKQQSALDLQKMRAEDKAETQRRDQEFKAMMGYGTSGRTGAGGSSGSTNVMDLVMGAARSKDPEEQRIALSQLEVLGGPEAAKMVAEKMFGRPMQQAVPADFVGLPGQSDVGPDAKRYEKASYIAEKAAVEFQRAFALTANKGEIKNFAEGEGQLMTNDIRANVLGDQVRAGKPLPAAAETAARAADPVGFVKADADVKRAATSETKADNDAKRTADANTLREITALRTNIAALSKGYLGETPDQAADRVAQLKASQEALKELEAQRKKPAGSFAPVAGSATKPPVKGTSVRDMIKAKGY